MSEGKWYGIIIRYAIVTIISANTIYDKII